MSHAYRVKIAADSGDAAPSSIPFSIGNPTVEHITGMLHLYKRQESDAGAEEPCTSTVCVLAVPGDMGVAEFCQFLSAHMPRVARMRMVRREDVPQSTCMALIELSDVAAARDFIAAYNGKAFNEIEPEIICRAVFTTATEIDEGSGQSSARATPSPVTGAAPHVGAPSGYVELPTCPVCLERLDEHISGVVTTVCNHKFHNECLQQWGDSSCPVCRYCSSHSEASQCEVCGTSTDLWICLICGHIGCGRYRAAHARDHYAATHHCYSLELETGRVWDYVGDGYVHRLIQSSLDGKLVEVPSPEPSGLRHGRGRPAAGASQAARCAEGPSTAPGGAKAMPTVDEERAMNDDLSMMEATYASKMDAVSREYTHLLTSQLESQRQYFEDLRTQDAATHQRELAQVASTAEAHATELAAMRKRAEAAEAQSQSRQKQVGALEGRLKAVEKEHGVLSELNRSLISNQQAWKDKVAAAEQHSAGKDAEVKDLREQVRDLMVYLEAAQMAGADGEMAGGTAQVGAAKPKRRTARR